MNSNGDYSALVEKEREIWLDKIFKVLLPTRIYERSKHTCYDTFLARYLKRKGITFAMEGDKCAILRGGEVFATWEPPVRRPDLDSDPGSDRHPRPDVSAEGAD